MSDMLIYLLRLAAATLTPILLTGAFTLLERKTRFAKWNAWLKQVIIGAAFGAFAVLSTEYGVPAMGGEAIVNVRDSAPLCAGLIFGAPAGFIAGAVGGLHRWLCVLWGGGMATRTACSLATFLAGVMSGFLRKKLFEGGRPGFISAFGVGTTMEVLHMLLILATNLDDVSYAFTFVQICAFPMILCNGIAVSASVLVSGMPYEKKELYEVREKRISRDFAFRLLVCVVIAFLVTSGFTQQIIRRVTEEDAELYRSVTLYLFAFMEILIYTALFILIYQMLKKKVILNLQKVNEGLNAITRGDLDTVINVRAYKEFSDLSDDVNATVATLRRYITEAEERIDKELEFARQIQHSALPSVFPPFKGREDFDLFASMDAAREVGGDFYDFCLPDPHTLIFTIADVSGKGIPAAMFMMTAKTLIKDLAESGLSVDEVLTQANKKLCESNDAGMFITVWIGRLDLRTGRLTYANAGHNPPIIRRSGGACEYLRAKPNFVLAGLETTRYRLNECELRAGDELYLYTDGVTEATDAAGGLFGEERLLKAFAEPAQRTASGVCGAVKRAIEEFVNGEPQSDDITMLSLRLRALTDARAISVYPCMEALPLIAQYLDERLSAAEVFGRLAKRAHIAADEICSNIVRYSGADTAQVSVERRMGGIALVFRDNGAPFDPTAAPDADIALAAEERGIGGLGIHMVRKMAAEMSYRRTESENVLTVVFEEGAKQTDR